MKKLVKLFRDPALFFQDAVRNRRGVKRGDTPTYVVGFSTWKQYVRKFFPGRNLTFLPREISEHEFNLVWSKKILSDRDSEIFIWGFKAPPYILQFIKKNRVKVMFVEDGFVRSVQLGASKASPMSLCLDSRTPYFNARVASDLEVMLLNHDFAADPELLERADKAIELLLKSGVSKYNHAAPVDVGRLYGVKNRKRVLVIGQVEDDASIEFGCEQKITNNDLVRLAAKENPGAQIIYKPHPDVLAGHRDMQSNPDDVASLALILRDKLPLAQAFDTIDHVYTITSLAGFEALLRKIKVTTIGAPFYSGWGLTDDRQPTARRTRKLELRELFAGAYLLYPRYFDPNSGTESRLEEIIAIISNDAQMAVNAAAETSSALGSKATVKPVAAIESEATGLLATYLVGTDLAYRNFMGNWFDERSFTHIPADTSEAQFVAKFKKNIDRQVRAEFFVSGNNIPTYLRKYMAASGRPIVHLSEGYLRSVGLASDTMPPHSLLLDRSAPHYDASRPSDLENILNGYDFEADTALMERAVMLQTGLIKSSLSKYNHVLPVADIGLLYGVKDRPRVLVLGQVESTPEFKLANPRNYTNNDLVAIAAKENPEAEIIFKPHPNVLNKSQSTLSDPGKIAHLCRVLDQDLPLAQALETVDSVYTISSLGGFEALLRGISTTVLGQPFYAGWGLGDDRQPLPRRRRTLTVQEVFAAAYILYPVYVDSLYKTIISAERAVEHLNEMVKARAQKKISGGQNALIELPETVPPVQLQTLILGDASYTSRMNSWFVDRKFSQIPATLDESVFALDFKSELNKKQFEFFIVTADCPPYLKEYAESSDKKVSYVTEGFLCSAEVDSTKYLPYSLLIDGVAPHYDGSMATDLETLIGTHNFVSDTELMTRARLLREKLLCSGLSKLNHANRVPDVQSIYGSKNRPRILVLGQVEDSEAFSLSNPRCYTNNDLVTIAAMENPNAQIIFKPAPEILHKLRNAVSNPAEVKHLCQILVHDLPLTQALETIDHVYTISSLGGFEALLREIKTTTLGLPFYAGWGLGDDRLESERRTRKLSINEVFAAAYVLYPKYVDPLYRMPISAERAIERLMESAKAARDSKNFSHPASPSFASTAVPAPAAAEDSSSLPAWFQGHIGTDLQAKIDSGKPVYVYFPWITEHDEILISRADGGEEYALAAFDVVKDIGNSDVRSSVEIFVRNNPEIYRKMIARRLVQLRKKINGVILAFDWAPVMRMVAGICKDLDIPTILIPHDSAFLDRDKYYRDNISNASVPVADVVLGWGGLQREIFVERGYPAEHFVAVGAAKLDIYHDYQSQLSRDQFCNLFGLHPSKKIVLFVAEVLDSQLDQAIFRESQRDAVSDLLNYSVENNCQLIIRLADKSDDIIGSELTERLLSSGVAAIDDAACYVVSSEEALFHCDVVTSINSMMLFEGVLLGRPAISLKYLEFTAIWEVIGVPAANSATALKPVLDMVLSGGWRPSEQGMNWAGAMLGVGEFDGLAAQRIRQYLKNHSNKNATDRITKLPSALDRLFSKSSIDVIGIPSTGSVLENTQKFLKGLTRARSVVSTRNLDSDLSSVSSVDIFFQWGLRDTPARSHQRRVANSLGKPLVIVEDGFIRSLDIGLTGGPALAIILDDATAYYDATKQSRLERLLSDGPDLDAEMTVRARHAIDKIVANRVSKYNHAPDFPVQIGNPGSKKILVIDQRFGDQSVESGLANEETYERMLYDIIRERPDCDIIVKLHPDAIKGGKSSYFSYERLEKFKNLTRRLYTVDYDVNPFALFDVVEDVYVGTSGMGFEALMAGKKVHCYGMPFYAGWGVTEDKIKLSRRDRQRSVEDLFHFAYIESSRYFHPEKNMPVEVEDIVDYIVSGRSESGISS